jgi:hypothetical protein
MSMLCFFDLEECKDSGECLHCPRFPGEEAAEKAIQAKKDLEAAEREALIKARDCMQIDPSYFAGRLVMQWDEAVYGFGATPTQAMVAAETEFKDKYAFAVRYREFMNK